MTEARAGNVFRLEGRDANVASVYAVPFVHLEWSQSAPDRGNVAWRPGLIALGLLLAAGCSNTDVVYVTLPKRDGPALVAADAADDAPGSGGLGAPDASPDAAESEAAAAPDQRVRSRCNPMADDAIATNVILLIADGYGREQIKATRMFLNGDTEPLSFETLPYHASITTEDANAIVTDSAASATAMATGVKVASYVLSRAIPGTGEDLTTALEIQQRRGKSGGLVTTHTPMTDATPAAFGAHANDRYESEPIAAQLLEVTRPAVLIGSEGPGFSAGAAAAAGYAVAQTEAELLALGEVERIAGVFGSVADATLAQKATIALDRLDRDADGFFLLVENEQTDTSGHMMDLPGVLAGATEFLEAVDAVLEWASDRDDTLIIVGADHETGGLSVSETAPQIGVVPAHAYATTLHTDAEVDFFAVGPGAARLEAMRDNADLFPLLAGYRSLRLTASNCAEGIVESGVVSEDQPQAAAAASTLLRVESAADGLSRVQGLLSFNSDFVELPDDAELVSARLYLRSRRPSPPLLLHRLLVDWSSETSWASLGGGVQTDGREAVAEPDVDTGPLHAGFVSVDVTASVRQWLAEPGSNLGWVMMPRSPGGLAAFDTPARATPPRLVVHYE